MPSKDTFDIKPIGQIVRTYVELSKVSIDPFARDKTWATYTNDLNPNTKSEYHLDAAVFLEMLKHQEVKADLVIFDPPYSPRQIKECYDSIGIKMQQLDAMRTNWQNERSLINDILLPGGFVISCGWNSMGMGKKRDYEFIAGIIVCHGVGHNDTIVMVEQKKGSGAAQHRVQRTRLSALQKCLFCKMPLTKNHVCPPEPASR